jgi:type III pantothenate kinase
VLDPFDSEEWLPKASAWNALRGSQWVVASVNPERLESFLAWLNSLGARVAVVRSHRDVPMELNVERAETVGIDRLLACVAAKKRFPAGQPFLVVQAGTAIALSFMDERGVFQGGAILPGIEMMTRSLQSGTAGLPYAGLTDPVPPTPGRNTYDAIRVGVYWAAAGAIAALRKGFQRNGSEPLPIVLTGGNGPLLKDAITPPVEHVPELTLEGLRITAERFSAN